MTFVTVRFGKFQFHERVLGCFLIFLVRMKAESPFRPKKFLGFFGTVNLRIYSEDKLGKICKITWISQTKFFLFSNNKLQGYILILCLEISWKTTEVQKLLRYWSTPKFSSIISTIFIIITTVQCPYVDYTFHRGLHSSLYFDQLNEYNFIRLVTV